MIKSSHHVFVFHDHKKVCKLISRCNFTEFPEFFGEGGCIWANFRHVVSRKGSFERRGATFSDILAHRRARSVLANDEDEEGRVRGIFGRKLEVVSFIFPAMACL